MAAVGSTDGADPAAAGPTNGCDRLVYDPTVGATGGLWSGGVPFGLPGDQRPDEALSLVYTSAPFTADLAILGRPRAIVHISSSASVIGVAVSLSDVGPDGVSSLVAKGMLNVTRRQSLTDPEPLPPGEVTELTVDVDATGWQFKSGHRVRLSIAAADWPNVWPTPKPGTLDVWHGPGHASRLVLPVVPVSGPLDAPSFRPSPLPARHAATSTPRPTWQVTRDLLSGRAGVTIQAETEHRTPDGTLIERDCGCTCEVDRVDPARATAHGWHACRSTHDGRTTAARADVRVASTADTFDVSIDLEVTVDGAPHATRRWTESIPRRLL